MSRRVWVVVQQRDGKLHRMSREALAAGQALAAAVSGTVEAVAIGHTEVASVVAELEKVDLAAVRVASHEMLADYTPGGYVAALAPAIRAEKPDYVLFPHTYQSVDFVPRLAQECGAGLLPEALSFAAGADGELVWKRPVLGGKLHAKVRARGDKPLLVSLQSGAFAADSLRAGSCASAPMALDLAGADRGREILGIEAASGEQVDLTKADAIVAVGRGVGGADKLAPIEELAKLLGAELGASRPVIDGGWLPRDRQIGSSGQTVAPKLYVALGISGAIQHLVGMKGSSVIVAVNKDSGAPIFKVAHYGIVGDLHELVPALSQAIREARG